MDNGYILLARKMKKGFLMDAPPLWLKLWVWMLLQARFRDGEKLKRGQFFTNIEIMRDAMAHKVGYRKQRPTRDQIRSAYEAFTKATMITTAKTTRGMIITICNYDKYQDPKYYEDHNEGPSENFTKTTDGPHYNRRRGNEGKKKENLPGKISEFKSRYPSPLLIDKAFVAIASTRKSNRVSDSILLTQLEKWNHFPVDQVEAGIRTYLEKDYAGQGKKEEYLLGIIRNNGNGQQQKAASVTQPAEFDFSRQFHEE